MGRFSDWMMKNDGDGREEDFSYRSAPTDDNNFDRYYAGRAFGDAPQRGIQSEGVDEPRRERRKLFSGGDRRKNDIPPITDSRTGSAVIIYTPKTYEDVQTLIDYLKRDEPAIVNLAGIADSSAQRILDFMSGAIYGLGGSIKRIVGSIFLLTPRGVKIMVPVDGKNRD